jgi:phosphoenolpyruvate carboxykinase (GTP)
MPGDLQLDGLGIGQQALAELLGVDHAAWHVEIDDIGRYLGEFGERLPGRLRQEYETVKRGLG